MKRTLIIKIICFYYDRKKRFSNWLGPVDVLTFMGSPSGVLFQIFFPAFFGLLVEKFALFDLSPLAEEKYHVVIWVVGMVGVAHVLLLIGYRIRKD